MIAPSRAWAALLLAMAFQLSRAVELDVRDEGSIQKASSIVAYGLMKYYTGNITNTPSTVGILPAPYYWWEAGAVWGGMLDYYHYTNDSTYNGVVHQALVSQVGPKYDYMVPLHQKDEGNDDQAFWGFATMSAAERDFNPPPPGTPSWLQLTINIWNTQVARWDLETCGGGLKWQIFTFNNGYDYKNAVSNGAFFQLSARLARYTGNSTYLDWAVKSWDWSRAVGLIDDKYNIYDGTDDLKNCSDVNGVQWTYSLGIYMYGSAVLYNYTNGSAIWAERTQSLLHSSAVFFSPFDNSTNVMFEVACEVSGNCNNDQWSFKAYLSRFMWATSQLAPFTSSAITSLLTTSAQAAAQSCSGGTDGVTCGAKWWTPGWDGSFGVGQQLSALETMQGLLIKNTLPPGTSEDVRFPAASSSIAPSPVPSETATAAAPTKSSSSQLLAHVSKAAAAAGLLSLGASLYAELGL